MDTVKTYKVVRGLTLTSHCRFLVQGKDGGFDSRFYWVENLPDPIRPGYWAFEVLRSCVRCTGCPWWRWPAQRGMQNVECGVMLWMLALRWQAAARILIAKTSMNFTNYDTHCPNCGLPFDSDEQFCPRCGVPLPTGGDGVATSSDEDAVPWTPVHVTAGLFFFLGLVIAAAFISGALGNLVPDYERALRTWVGVHLLALGIVTLVWILGVRSASNPLDSLGIRLPKTAVGLSVVLTVIGPGLQHTADVCLRICRGTGWISIFCVHRKSRRM